MYPHDCLAIVIYWFRFVARYIEWRCMYSCWYPWDHNNRRRDGSMVLHSVSNSISPQKHQLMMKHKEIIKFIHRIFDFHFKNTKPIRLLAHISIAMGDHMFAIVCGSWMKRCNMPSFPFSRVMRIVFSAPSLCYIRFFYSFLPCPVINLLKVAPAEA